MSRLFILVPLLPGKSHYFSESQCPGYGCKNPKQPMSREKGCWADHVLKKPVSGMSQLAPRTLADKGTLRKL